MTIIYSTISVMQQESRAYQNKVHRGECHGDRQRTVAQFKLGCLVDIACIGECSIARRTAATYDEQTCIVHSASLHYRCTKSSACARVAITEHQLILRSCWE